LRSEITENSGDVNMSTIEERIEKHKQFFMNAERMYKKYAELKEKWLAKYLFHEKAISNLEAKKKVD